MELWIRSQDKTDLVKVDRLTIDDTNSIFGDYNDFYLGTYKTKERALEVLDAIHQRLVNIQCIELAGVEYITSHMKRTGVDCVYEMPEE